MKILVVVDKDNKKKDKAINYIKLLFKNYDIEELHIGEISDEYFKNFSFQNYFKDYVIAVGGDGTIIKTAKIFYKYNMKILAINIGQLGFLSGIDNIDILKNITIKDISNSSIIKRDLLNCKIIRNNKIIYKNNALNEFLICSDKIGNMGKYEFRYEDNKIINLFHSDGVIVSTETGSTAYSFSCGGPIVENDVHCIILIPIRSHSCNERAFILNDKNTIKVKILRNNQILKIDGRDDIELMLNDELIFSKNKQSISFINLNKQGFFERAISRIKTL